jgi:hypothetical protein
VRNLPNDAVPAGRLHAVVRDGETVWLLQCPGCGEWADIDDDQLHGRVSVDHDPADGGCGFHETRDWMNAALKL